MDKGRIVERGSHRELWERNGVYARLWLLQQRMDETGAMQRETS